MAGKPRISLAVELDCRDGTILQKDSFILNGYVDKNDDGVFVTRRPGGNPAITFGIPSYIQGQFYFNGFEYVVINDTLQRTTGATLSGTTGALVTSVPPQWGARYKHVMLVFQDRMWVIAGQLLSSTLGNDVWSTQDGVTWALQTSTAGIGSRVGLGGCVFNDRMWIMGGFQGATVFSDVWSSVDGTNWVNSTTTAPWGPRFDFGCVAANNGIYVIGGFNASSVAQNDVWFTSDGATWSKVNTVAPFTIRGGASCLFFNGKLYVIGGAQIFGVANRNDVWSSPDGITWTQVTAAAFGTARCNMASCVYNGQMFIIAGLNSAGIEMGEVWRSTTGASWLQVTANPGFNLGGFQGGAAVVFKTPSTVSQFRYDTIWTTGGLKILLAQQQAYRFNLDTSTATTYTLSPTIANQFYQFNTFANGTKLLLKNQSNFWVLDSGTLTKVTDANYPPQTVPGLQVLNDFAYVMTPDGEIHACAIDNPLLWPSLQFIVANFEDDKGTGLGKYLNYLVAWGTYTTQYFYDAGNPPPGISISPYGNANQKIGMIGQNASGAPGFPTFANVGNTIAFLGQTLDGFQGLYILNGMTPQKISTAYIDRILINDGAATLPQLVWVASAGTGHNFVICNLNAGPFALVFDLEMKRWYIWSSVSFGYNFSFLYYGNITVDEAQGSTLWVGGQTGAIYGVGTGLYTDGPDIIDVISQTKKIDGGSLERKFFGTMSLVADQTAVSSICSLSWSDDDYQTFSTPVSLDMALQRPRVNRLGSARRRAFRLETQDQFNKIRWEALELGASEGES